MMSNVIRDTTAAIEDSLKAFRFDFIAELDIELRQIAGNADAVRYLGHMLAGFKMTGSGGHSVNHMLEQMQREIVATRLTQYLNRI